MALGMLLEDGWPECDPVDCDQLTIPGTPLKLLIQRGFPHIIMQAFFRDVDAYNEPANNSRGYSDEGSWTQDNSVYTSNHKGATAVDWNWSDHTFGVKDGGWNGSVLINGSQVPQMRELLAWYEGMIFWGNDWNSPIDSMHFQMGYNTYGPKNAVRVQSFIDRKIRADGFSTYRRGGVPRGGGSAVEPSAPTNPIPTVQGLTAAVLWGIAGRPDRMTVDRYAQLLPGLIECFHQCDANTIDRRAMWFAQVFHESGGLYYTEEIASGAAYEGRTDLGNTRPGDGVRFKGRSFIQVTGRSNYTKLSGWAFGKGYVPTATYFIDHPEQLSQDQYAFMGAVWYWTTQRPMNAAADARNIDLATYYVNGGYTGLDDRKAIYARALAHNAELLDPTSLDPLEALLMANTAYPSWSIYATPGEPDVPLVNMIRAIDAKIHRDAVEDDAAFEGDIDAIQRIARTAAGLGTVKTASAIARARGKLEQINTAHPDWIAAATGKALA